MALLGFTHFLDAIHGWTRDASTSLAAAEAWAGRAMACNRAGPRPMQLQAKLLLWHHEHEAALELLRHAVALAPDSAYAHFHLGEAEMWCGRGGQALVHMDRALRLDANDHGLFLAVRANTLWTLGEHEASRAAALRAMTRNPGYAWPHGTLAAVLVEQGEGDAAQLAAVTACRLNRRFSADFAERVMPYRLAEHRQRMVRAWRSAGMPEHEGRAQGEPA
jgi:protein O-GlcNAc transferase